MNDTAEIAYSVNRVKAGELRRPTSCDHLDMIHEQTPAGFFCEDCVKTGDTWVHLRICLQCGYVGCCNSSKNKHAMAHAKAQGHPVVMSLQPGEDWLWCFEHQDFLLPTKAA